MATIVGDLLTEAKALYAKGASVGAEARDKDDIPVDTYSAEAVKFSLYGALRRAAWERRDSTGLDHALTLLGADYSRDAGMGGLARDDDDDRVNALFDAAIARANGGPVPDRSLDAERRMLDPNDPDHLDKTKQLERGELNFAEESAQPKQDGSERTKTDSGRSE
jgi:hypothetical protein